MVSFQLVGLMSMLVTGHCYSFIVAREFTDQGQCNHSTKDPSTPVFDFKKLQNDNADFDPNKLDSLINYNYFATETCIRTTLTYTIPDPVFLVLDEPGDCSEHGYAELDAKQCEDQQSTRLDVWKHGKKDLAQGGYDIPAWKGAGTWRVEDESCGCYATTDVMPSGVLYQKLQYNRYVVSGKCKEKGVAYGNKPGRAKQRKICRKVNEHGEKYAKMTCFGNGVEVNVFEDEQCRGKPIGSIKHNDCSPRNDPFPTYIRFTCGYKVPAMHVRSYSKDSCLNADKTRDEVLPLGVCMTSVENKTLDEVHNPLKSGSRNYFDVGNPFKTIGSGDVPLGKDRYVSYKTLRFSSSKDGSNDITLEKYTEEKIEICLAKGFNKDTAEEEDKEPEGKEPEKLSLSCNECSDAYDFLDGEVHLNVQAQDPYTNLWAASTCIANTPYIPAIVPPGVDETTKVMTTTTTTRLTTTSSTKAQCRGICGRDDTFGWLRKCTWESCRGCPTCQKHCQPECLSSNKPSWAKKCTMKTCKFCSNCHQCHSSCKPAKGDQTWWMCKKPWCKNCEACVSGYAKYSINPEEKTEFSRMQGPSTGIIIAITISGLMVCLGLRLVRTRNRSPNEHTFLEVEDEHNM